MRHLKKQGPCENDATSNMAQNLQFVSSARIIFEAIFEVRMIIEARIIFETIFEARIIFEAIFEARIIFEAPAKQQDPAAIQATAPICAMLISLYEVLTV